MNFHPLRNWFCIVLIVVAGCALGSFPRAHAQQESAGKRRIVEHAAPAYPALARSMALEGTVKVEALVASDGSVKAVDIKGGHPVLAQAAAKAVRQWRWEPAGHESHEQVEVKFAPE
jgi:TonB family protein